MKRTFYFLFIIAVLLTLFSVSASAVGEEYLDEFFALVDFDADEIKNIGIESLVEQIIEAVSDEGGRISGFFSYVFASVLIIALSSSVSDKREVSLGVSCVFVAGAVGFIFEIAIAAASALSEMSAFFLALIPIATGVTLAGGGVSTAGTEAVAMGSVFGTVSGISAPLLLPLSAAMLSLSAVSALGGGVGSAALSRIRSVFSWGLGIVTAIMLGGISLQTTISAASDSAAMRVAKYSASGFLPVIGGTVSASLSSLAAGLSYAKGIIGAGGIYMLVLTAISPLLLILIYRAAISLGSGLLLFLGSNEGAGVFGSVTASLDALLSVYGVSFILYVFEIVMFMKSGVAIL